MVKKHVAETAMNNCVKSTMWTSGESVPSTNQILGFDYSLLRAKRCSWKGEYRSKCREMNAILSDVPGQKILDLRTRSIKTVGICHNILC